MPHHRLPHPALAAPFVVDTVLKRDVFGEISAGHMADAPETIVTRRRVAGAAPWVRRFAWHLAGREIRALQKLAPVDGTPKLLGVDSNALYRSWIEGTPLHVARPKGNTAYFRDAKRLLRSLHRAGITHNDLAKPQNWLMTPDGKAALIDMQLATVFPRRTRLFRLLAREDLRHLLKHKRSFCREALTPAERRMLATKSLPARIWMASFKPVYNLVTRGIFNWSDGEGTGDRMDTDGKAIMARLAADPAITGFALVPYPYPRQRGIGLYLFAEPAPGTDGSALERRLRGAPRPRPDLVQAVAALPRDASGTVREDLLRLVAINQVERIPAVARDEAALAATLRIAEDRRNFTDRRLKG
ncbi:serine/threonine protein kinase [Aurantimonas sp. A2-1-M11]|uniref:serine/threonine protein kinase n=1 Tax=Aurantimonas sp. A2-1-M11 TaxID=3113712 RepID=UPI002F93CA38